MSEDQQEVLQFLKIFTRPRAVGSATIRENLFPSDLDALESSVICCGFQEARLKAQFGIQNTISALKNSPFGLSDFKAGIDERFKIYIGFLERERVRDYDSDLILQELENLREQSLLDFREFSFMKNLVVEHPSIEEWGELHDALREKWIVRWNEKEILNGYKLLPGRKKLFLYNALSSGSLVKLDIFAPIDGRYTEAESWILINSLDRCDQKEPLTLQLSDPKVFVLNVSSDAIRFKQLGKNWKSLKRIFSLANFLADEKMVKLLLPLFSSKLNLTSQFRSSLETLKEMIQKKFDFRVDIVLDSFLTFVHLFEKNKLTISQKRMLHRIIPMLMELSESLVLESRGTIDLIDEITDVLSPFIEKETKEFMKKHKLDINDWLAQKKLFNPKTKCSITS